MRTTMLRRRTLLRGMLGASGVAVGLPLLEAMLDAHGEAHADGTSLPLRFGVWFWGNGTQPGAWAPATQGAGWEATGLLSGLAAVKSYVNVVSGGVLPVPGVNNPHVEGAVGILAAGNPLLHDSYSGQSDDWNFLTVPSPSVDQVAADTLAAHVPAGGRRADRLLGQRSIPHHRAGVWHPPGLASPGGASITRARAAPATSTRTPADRPRS